METYYFISWQTKCSNGNERYYYSKDYLHLDRIEAQFEKTIKRKSTIQARLWKVDDKDAKSKFDLIREYYG